MLQDTAIMSPGSSTWDLDSKFLLGDTWDSKAPAVEKISNNSEQSNSIRISNLSSIGQAWPNDENNIILKINNLLEVTTCLSLPRNILVLALQVPHPWTPIIFRSLPSTHFCLDLSFNMTTEYWVYLFPTMLELGLIPSQAHRWIWASKYTQDCTFVVQILIA